MDFPELPEGTNDFDRMIQGLRCKKPFLNMLCTEILVRSQTEMGANIVRPLIVEASLPGKRPDHRVRILEVVRLIAGPLGPDEFFTLMQLTKHPIEKVARKAAELIDELPSCACGKSVVSSGAGHLDDHDADIE